jgi:hypothetical protein
MRADPAAARFSGAAFSHHPVGGLGPRGVEGVVVAVAYGLRNALDFAEIRTTVGNVRQGPRSELFVEGVAKDRGHR